MEKIRIIILEKIPLQNVVCTSFMKNHNRRIVSDAVIVEVLLLGIWEYVDPCMLALLNNHKKAEFTMQNPRVF